ncbi:unnamed protein product [Orchesella dallaii]|uniref:ABC transmembrane type-2 domain-containing protein n=1 Tax=Orchesella dallaii TaxID=48710 RepID=A0ABP1S829_9HEXA
MYRIIGIMRNGRLLEEDSPQVLLQEYGMNSLEDIVLAISRLDAKNEELEDGEDNNDSLSEVMGDKNAIIVRYMRAVRSVEKKDIFIVEEELAKPIALGGEPGDTQKAAFWNKTTALLIKNFTVLLRNIGFLIFLFGLPGSQMILISLAIGADPKDILVGVVNGEYCDFESDSWRNYQLKNCPLTKVGDNGSLSCYLLATLPSENFIYERSPSIEHALQRVQTGHTYGYIHFPVDYTLNVECKIGGGHGKCGHWDYVKPGSKITFSLDMTSKGVSANLKRLYLEGYLDSMKYLKNICRRNLIAGLLSEYSGDLPFEFGPPIYGKDDMSFNDFLAPSLLLALLFFFPLCSSAVTYIGEKRSGTLDRAIVAGIGTFEFIAGYFLIQVGIMLVQALISFLILIYVFDMQIVGSLGLAMVISLLVGVSGMVLGFFVGVLCKDEFQAVMLAMGTFFPNIILAGICWPSESMIKALQRLSMFLPCTLAGESIRSILNRGWTFSHKKVWPGFFSTFAWILVYCFLTILVFRMKHRI